MAENHRDAGGQVSITKLRSILKRRTAGPWKYEAERYSAKCVVGLKPDDDRWIAHFQPAFNGEENAKATCAAVNLAEAMLRVCEAAGEVNKDATGAYAGLCNVRYDLIEALYEALTAFDVAVRKELGMGDENPDEACAREVSGE